MKYLNLFLICLICWSLPIAGCTRSLGPKPDGLPSLVPITLTVTQDAQPLADAKVAFIPADGAKNWFTGGTTDSNGQIVAHTYGTHKGSPLGKFKVIVTKEVQEESGTEVNAINPKTFSLVESQYGQVTTTPLEIEVVKSSKTFTVDVGKAVREKRP